MGIKYFLFVGLGGAVGSILRAAIAHFFSTHNLTATILANLGGAFLIGVLSKWGGNLGSDEIFRAFWILGICGGFTTFSTFGMDLFNLLQRENWIVACGYISANFFGTLFFIWLGFRAAILSF